MPIFIYNSLARKKEEFTPLASPKVNIYTCGVTVYDDSHIGHARSLYIFDLIRRYLGYRGFEVKFVRNITDVDDKIINRANELKVEWQTLVEKYIGRYYEDLKALAIEKADFEPRATENINDMVKYIQKLINKGYAYESGGDVYFSVRKFPAYGRLSGQSIDQMETGVRIGPSELKQDSLDFALWKKSKAGEPSWDSPWGKGRPGWHIECSVMSHKFLKTDTLDIHAGGRDLIFPHHENEIAQAEALTGKQFAKYWIHHGLLTINGQKMAKSSGNFITIKDALNKYPADVLKLFYLQAHYSSPIDFSWERLEEVHKAILRFEILFTRIDQVRKSGPTSSARTADFIEKHKNDFIKAMDDDFNTPDALASLFALVNDINKFMDTEKDSEHYFEIVNYAKNTLIDLGSILGITYKSFQSDVHANEDEINSKILARANAKQAKEFALADQIRKELEEKGIILEDTKEGTTWRRKL